MATTTETVTKAAGAAAEAASKAAEHHGGGLPNPMHQFEIVRYWHLNLFGYDASFTNSALSMVFFVSAETAVNFPHLNVSCRVNWLSVFESQTVRVWMVTST